MSIQGKLTLRNYRCFDWNNPAVLEFEDGFVAFVGANNSGKTAALRSIYELRNLFSNLLYVLNQGFSPLGTTDIAELGNESDPGRFQCEIEIVDYNHHRAHQELVATAVTLECSGQAVKVVKLKAVTFSDKRMELDGANIGAAVVSVAGKENGWSHLSGVIGLAALCEFANELAQSKYFPAFRNAINEGAGNYYDLPVGTALVNTWDQWKAGNIRSNQRAIGRVEREIAELLGFSSLQINADQSGKTLDVIIDGRPRQCQEFCVSEVTVKFHGILKLNP